jgi:hypothetical protein
MKKEDITGLFDVTGKVAIILGGAGAIGSTASREPWQPLARR